MDRNNRIGLQVKLEGEFAQSGFLFLCMKQSEKLGITGEARFNTENEVQLLLYGGKEKLNEFLEWSKTCLHPQEVNILTVLSIGYRDKTHFKIL